MKKGKKILKNHNPSKVISGDRITLKIDGKVIGATTAEEMKENIIDRFSKPIGVWTHGPMKFIPSPSSSMSKKHQRLYNKMCAFGLKLHTAGYSVDIKVAKN